MQYPNAFEGYQYPKKNYIQTKCNRDSKKKVTRNSNAISKPNYTVGFPLICYPSRLLILYRKTYHFFILICIDIDVFRYIVSDLSVCLKILNYIYKKNIKMRLNIIYLD